MKELKESEIHGNRKILVGQVYFNYKQEPYTVVSYTDRKNVLIQFNDDIGCTKRVASWDIKRGRIKNPGERHVYGTGYLGTGTYTPTTHRLHSDKWVRMLDRCYSGKLESYEDCTVTPEWHNFQVFSHWLDTKLQSWGCSSISPALDKDILCEGLASGKVYSPETCCLVPQQLNSLFTSDLDNSDVGVYKRGSRYYSKINKREQGAIHLGSFDCIEEAKEVYWKAKTDFIMQTVDLYATLLEDEVLQKCISKVTELKERHGIR